MALMVTPMLNIVKAADDVTCTKKYHYFFIEEETAYIKSDYTLTDKGLALTNGNGTNQSVLGDGVKLLQEINIQVNMLFNLALMEVC